MVENFMESYHNSRLHHGIHDWAPSSGASYTDYEPGDGAMFGFNRTLEPDGGFNPTLHFRGNPSRQSFASLTRPLRTIDLTS